MPHVFVKASNENNHPIVAEMLEFEFLPRVGERLFIDDGSKQRLLEVEGVQHFPTSVSKSGSGEAAHLECKLIESWDS